MASVRTEVLPSDPSCLPAIFRGRASRLAGLCIATAMIAGVVAPPAHAMTRTEKTFNSWTVVCVENENQPKQCSMLQTVQRQQPNQGFLLIWSISTGQGDGNKELTEAVTVPANVSIKEGIRLFIGDGDPVTLGYDLCGPRVCIARTPFTPETVATIKGSKKASASYVQASKQLVQVDLDLTAFSDAYDYLVQQLSS